MIVVCQILPESIFNGNFTNDDDEIFRSSKKVQEHYEDIPEVTSELNTGRSDESQHLNFKDNGKHHTSIQQSSPSGDSNNGYDESDESNLPPNILRILRNLEIDASPSVKKERRKRASDQVANQAYMRSLNEFQKLASTSDEIDESVKSSHQDWLSSEKQKREIRRHEVTRLRDVLDAQVSDHQRRLELDRNERLSARANCIVYRDDTAEETIKRRNFANELLTQINENQNRKLIEKNQALEEETEYLDHIAMEMDLSHVADRAKHLEKQKYLLESWERDNHLRNIKKLQNFGQSSIKNYMNRNDLHDSDAYQTQLGDGNRASMSVGFDSRLMN